MDPPTEDWKKDTRDLDPNWFIRIPSSYEKISEKSQFFDARDLQCQRRYISNAEKAVKRKVSKDRFHTHFRDVFDQLMDLCNEICDRRYCRRYCNRHAPERFCDDDGSFKCSGPWYFGTKRSCSIIGHVSYPYCSAKDREEFANRFQYDHVIDHCKVVQGILAAVHELSEVDERGINFEYFFNLLVGKINLRLVVESCHDKSRHLGQDVDPVKFYIPL